MVRSLAKIVKVFFLCDLRKKALLSLQRYFDTLQKKNFKTKRGGETETKERLKCARNKKERNKKKKKRKVCTMAPSSTPSFFGGFLGGFFFVVTNVKHQFMFRDKCYNTPNMFGVQKKVAKLPQKKNPQICLIWTPIYLEYVDGKLRGSPSNIH